MDLVQSEIGIQFVGHIPNEWLDELTSQLAECDCAFARGLDFSASFIPDIIVVYQTHFDEFSPDEINRVIGRYPLARWVIAFSPWCESMGRTQPLFRSATENSVPPSHRHWPIGWIVPANHLATRLNQELTPLVARYEESAQQATGKTAPSSCQQVSALASREESFRYSCDIVWQDRNTSKNESRDDRCSDTFVVKGLHGPTCQAVRDTLAGFGLQKFSETQKNSIEWNVIVIDEWDDDGQASVQKAVAAHAAAQVVVVCDLVATHTRQQILAEGYYLVSALRFAAEFRSILDLTHSDVESD